MGYLKGKSAIHLARYFGEVRRNFVGHHFWARGYLIRRYIQNQESEDRKTDQMKFS